jgi:tRNA threonylcarbamoyl adenosine modification protein YjeE
MTARVVERIKINTPELMHEFGLRLAKNLRVGDLVLLTGPLGAGKTTLTRGVGEGLQTIGTVSSPTFVIARTHQRETGEAPLVHVDAYRLSSPAEFDDLDIDLERSITLVEWGRGFTNDLADSWLDIEIDRGNEDDSRIVTVTGHGPGWQERGIS